MKTYLFFVVIILVTVGLNSLAQKFLRQQWNLWLGYGIPALGMVLFMWAVSDPSTLFIDFTKAYYPGGRLIVENPSGLYYSSQGVRCVGLVNIPIIATLFTPLSFLNLNTAHFLFTGLSSLAIFIACYFLVKLTKVSGYKRIALLGLFVINGPLYYSLKIGNTTHIILLLLLAVFFCISTKRDIGIGILLAIAALIKIPLFLLGIYFTLRQRWRVLAGFCISLLGIVGASLFLFGFDLHGIWYHECIQPFSGKPLAAYNVQSVDAFLARLLTNTNRGLENWWPIEVGWSFKILRYTLLSVLLGTTIWICWRSKPPSNLETENLEFSIVLCLSLLISPISWTHYYLFLLLPFTLYLGKRLAVPSGRIWSSLMLVSILLTSLPVIAADIGNPILRVLYFKLLISHYFVGGIILLGVLLAARWQSSKRTELCSEDVTVTGLYQ
jgi:hypothetical protein